MGTKVRGPAKRRLVTVWCALVGLASVGVEAQVPPPPAFPGAEGFGAGATGGRGGRVVKVTTLAPSGPGSLGAALALDQPRIIVFEVSGVIDARSLPEATFEIARGDLTIAGQTASWLGRGITIHGHLFTDYGGNFGNIILRHLRVRPPLPGSGGQMPPNQHDAIQFSSNRRVILDHVDVSHGADENIDLWNGAQDITVQWSTIGFGAFNVAGSGQHNYGLINGPGGGRISVHHNLFVHNRNRSPAIAEGPADVINNVIYNFREGFVHNNPAGGTFNILGNSFRSGGNAITTPLWFDPEDGALPSGYHVLDNYVDHPGRFVGRVDDPFGDNRDTAGANFRDQYSFYCCGIGPALTATTAPYDYSSFAGYVPVTRTNAASARDAVLEHAGAWPHDQIAEAARSEYAARTGAWGNRYTDPAHWLSALPSPSSPALDTDDDGMPDSWEATRGLDPARDDSSAARASGYTAVEEYLNELADALLGDVPPPAAGVFANGFE